MAAHIGNQQTLKWTPEHDEMVRAMHAAGDSGAWIAAEVNRQFRTDYTRNAVIGRKHRLGLTEPTRKRGRPQKVSKPAKKPNPSDTVPRPKWSSAPIITREEITLRCAEVVPRNIPLMQLADGDCRWPEGDGPFTFCGHTALPDLPYCLAHQRLSVRPPSETRRNRPTL